MAIENDFLPFANGGSANVVTQSAYAALTSLLQNGFSSGVAQSNQLNKVWRQSSIMAAVVAQFIVNQTGQTAIDDGTTATLLANLTAAVSASVPGVVGSVRNLVMSVTAASATATLTADEIIVETALGGLRYCLPNFSKTINLATTGAGGMDTGAAPTSGYVALYAIYNPTTGVSALLAKNATSAVQPNVYGGANMPAGYTASALVSVWPTNGSGQFPIGYQLDRTVSTADITVLSTSTVTGSLTSLTSLSIASAVPQNAKTVSGSTNVQSGAASITSIVLSGVSTPIGAIHNNLNSGAGAAGIYESFGGLAVITPQTIFYGTTNTAGTPGISIQISGYTF